MSEETPRTDAADKNCITDAAFIDFARELERENNRLRTTLQEIATANSFGNIGRWAINRAKLALSK